MALVAVVGRAALVAAVVAVAACGGGPGVPDSPPRGIDAARTDARADAGGPDADAARVSVTVYTLDWRALDPTAIAIFSDPAGAVVQHGMVDAMGQASAVLPDGGSVTVLQAFVENTTHSATMTTIRRTRGGEHYTINGRSSFTEVAWMTATIPNAPETRAMVYTPCGYHAASDPTDPTDLDAAEAPDLAYVRFYSGCSSPTFDALTVVDHPASGDRSFVWQEDVRYVPYGMFEVPDAWQPTTPAQVTIANVPAGLSQLVWSFGPYLAFLPQSLEYAQVPYPAAGSHAATYRVPGAAGHGTLLVAETGSATTTELDAIARVIPGAPRGAEVLDFDAPAVPVATDPVQAVNGVSWTERGAGTPDARLVEWHASWQEGPRRHYAHWFVVEPPDGASVTTLPGLPAEYAGNDPTIVDPGVIELTAVQVMYLDYSNLDGYDAARPHGYHLRWYKDRFRDVAHDVRYSRSR